MRKYQFISILILITLLTVLSACQNYSSNDAADSAVLLPDSDVFNSVNKSANTCTVSFDVGSDNYWIPKPISVTPGTKLTKEQLPILLSSIYEFSGWTSKQGDYSKKVEPGKFEVTSDVTLYPLWKAIKYKLTYETQGKVKAPQAVELTKKKILTSEHLPDISDSEYFLEGWYADVIVGDKTERMKISAGEFSITSDTVLYAKFYRKYEVGDIIKIDNKSIGIIFRAATQTSPALGMALFEKGGLIFSNSDKTRSEYCIELLCDADGDGFKDGSKSWNIICDIDPDATSDPAASYPAFEFALNYADYFEYKGEKILKGTEYESGWYIGSIAEFKDLYKNYTQIRDVLNGEIKEEFKDELAKGLGFGDFHTEFYETCNQSPDADIYSYFAYMKYNGKDFEVVNQYKYRTYPCSGIVRPFRTFE